MSDDDDKQIIGRLEGIVAGIKETISWRSSVVEKNIDKVGEKVDGLSSKIDKVAHDGVSTRQLVSDHGIQINQFAKELKELQVKVDDNEAVLSEVKKLKSRIIWWVGIVVAIIGFVWRLFGDNAVDFLRAKMGIG